VALLLSTVWAGAALAVDAPISEAPGETAVRLPLSLGRSLLHREPDAADFRAGFPIRLD
jgi:hypothetical protein